LDFDTKQKILITHALYADHVLTDELVALGFKITGRDRLNLAVNGSLKDTIKLNLQLRTAHRVLYHLLTFKAYTLEMLYKKVKGYNWLDVIPEDGYFSINSYCNQKNIRDNRIVNLKAKDAIVDRFMQETGLRPDSGNDNSQLVLFIYWVDNICSVYFDTSGESIAKHGYRLHGWKAPLSEALAASIVLSTNWDQESPFINPMCGSGTLAIEAALLLTNRFPGLYRQNYSFMHLKGYELIFYEQVRGEIDKQILPKKVPQIIASDIHAGALRLAKMNARKAGVEDLIWFSRCNFEDTPLPEGSGIVIMNPEYGERMGDVDRLKDTYKEIGDFFKNRCQGRTGYVFTGNPELAKSIGLRTKRKTPFMNGKIECRLLEYELYQGTKKGIAFSELL
jgi:putative N6-adenine-specific DNA methylase